MSNYESVTKALAEGVEPAMLCATCPWDRNCVNPPAMSTADVRKAIDSAAEEDKAKAVAAQLAGQPAPMPAATLMMVAAYSGRDTALQACPVLAVRLRSAEGRKAAEGVRALMQNWEES